LVKSYQKLCQKKCFKIKVFFNPATWADFGLQEGGTNYFFAKAIFYKYLECIFWVIEDFKRRFFLPGAVLLK